MTFTDPFNSPQIRPLTDIESIADALDLFVPHKSRARGALLVLLCDAEARPLVPVLIDELDTMPTTQIPRMLHSLVTQLSSAPVEQTGTTVLVALARRGPLTVNGTDRRWARTIREAFRGRLPLLGIHLITFDGSVPLPESRAAA